MLRKNINSQEMDDEKYQIKRIQEQMRIPVNSKENKRTTKIKGQKN